MSTIRAWLNVWVLFHCWSYAGQFLICFACLIVDCSEVYIKAFSKGTPFTIREVKASCIGQLVKISGIITRCSDVKPLMQVAVYTCEECGFEIYQVSCLCLFRLSNCICMYSWMLVSPLLLCVCMIQFFHSNHSPWKLLWVLKIYRNTNALGAQRMLVEKQFYSFWCMLVMHAYV